MGYESANKIKNLLKIDDFYNLTPQDQKQLLSEIDPNLQNLIGENISSGTNKQNDNEQPGQQQTIGLDAFRQKYGF
jgi:hypothetical protein